MQPLSPYEAGDTKKRRGEAEPARGEAPACVTLAQKGSCLPWRPLRGRQAGKLKW